MKTLVYLCIMVSLIVVQAADLQLAVAQIGIQPSVRIRDEIFLPAPRALQRLLSEGRTAIREGRYADGIGSLGAILQDDTDTIPEDLRGQDFFIRLGRDVDPKNAERDPKGNRARGNQTSARYTSIKSEVINELNLLPEDGRKALEILFGVKARQLLDEAIAKRDFEAIATVARRYIHTDAGYDAMLIIAQSKLTSGYPLAAADILQMMLDYPAARSRYGVGLVEAATTCWLQAGNRARATSTIKLASRDFPNESLVIGGQQIPLENWSNILKSLEADLVESTIDRSTDAWLVSGGTSARNATSTIGMPLPNERWSWAIHSSRPEGTALLQAEEIQRKNGRQLLPKIELRMLGNTIISRSNDSTIIGLDFESGLLKWQRTTPATVAPLKSNAWENGDNDVSNELKNRIWGSNAFGRISCDSQRCYHIVHKLGEVEEARGLGMGSRNSSSTRLEGLSIGGEGEILWSLGGADSDEPDLMAAYFLGPPLPYAGQLFSLIEINGQIELVVLAPETGKLLWRQQLAAAIYQIEFDQGRQSHGLTPSISDGVVICPTGIGGVVALDLLTRTLRWGGTYASNTVRGPMGLGAGAFGGSEYDPLESRWADEALVVENGVVVLTPQESDGLLCYDLLTGEELLRRQRSTSCYVAGIHGQDLILVNSRSVQALDITTRGTPRWEKQFPDSRAITGKGIWKEHSLMLPLTGNSIIELDLKSGEILDSASVSQPLGNIFAHKGVLLSVAPTAISAYFTRQQLKTTVDERLGINPKDTWGLNYRSQLLLAEGKVADAFRMLLESYAIDSEDFETRFFLVDAMLVGLQQDFGYFSQYASQLDSIVLPSTPQRLRYLQLMAKGLVEKADHFGAFKQLWQIMLERQEALVSGAQSRNNRIQLSSEHNADLDAWFAAELGRTYEKCEPQQQAEIRQWVVDVFAKLKTTVITVRRQVLRHMVQLPAADEENIDLAKSLMRNNEQTAAEQVLLQLVANRDAAVRQSALKLLNEFPEAERSLNKSGNDSLLQPWPSGEVVRQLDETNEAIYPIGRPIEVISQRFGRPTFNLAVSDRLVISDANGKSIYHLGYRPATGELPGSQMRAEVRGGLMLLESSSELIAFDYYRGRDANQAILWRYSLDAAAPREQYRTPSSFENAPTPLGMQRFSRLKIDERPYVEVGPLLASAKIVQSSGSIIGLDPYSGRKLWTRDGYGNDTRFAGDRDGNVLCAVCPSRRKTDFIDARDGKLIKSSVYLVDEMFQRWSDKAKPDWEQWYSYDKWIVDYVVEGDASVRFRIWNPLEEKTLFETRVAENVRVAQCQRNTIALLDPNGQMQIIELDSQQVHKLDVPVDQELVQIGMLKFADHLVVVSNNTRSVNSSPMSTALIANGYVYSINPNSHQLDWSPPARLYNMAIPLIQPRNSPLMAVFQTNAFSELPIPSLGLLDLRSGKIAYAVEGLRVDRSAFSMEIRPQTHEIAIMISERYYRFKVTDDPPPPEPVAHFGTPLKRDNTSLFDQ